MSLISVRKLNYFPLLFSLSSCVDLPEAKKLAAQSDPSYPLLISLFEAQEESQSLVEVAQKTVYFHGRLSRSGVERSTAYEALPLVKSTLANGETHYVFPEPLKAEDTIVGVFSKSPQRPDDCGEVVIKNGAPKTFVEIPLCRKPDDGFHILKGIFEFPLVMSWRCQEEDVVLQMSRKAVKRDQSVTPSFWVTAQVGGKEAQVLEGAKIGGIGASLSAGYLMRGDKVAWVLQGLDYQKDYLQRADLSHVRLTQEKGGEAIECQQKKVEWAATQFYGAGDRKITLNYTIEEKLKKKDISVHSYRFQTFIQSSSPVSEFVVTTAVPRLFTSGQLSACKNLRASSAFQTVVFCRKHD